MPVAVTEDELADTDRTIAWLVSLIESTDDLYLRDTGVPPGAASRLESDLGIDSLGRIGLFYAILDALGVDGDERAVAGWRTMGDVVEFVRGCPRPGPP
jgi:hypothetical protein